MIRSGVISVDIGRLPAMNTTEPYSPMPRASASAKPVSAAGAIAGSTTRVTVCQRLAPSIVAASSSSGSSCCKSGCTERTTNGRPVKISAIVMP